MENKFESGSVEGAVTNVINLTTDSAPSDKDGIVFLAKKADVLFFSL
jgi:hypothetical protein